MKSAPPVKGAARETNETNGETTNKTRLRPASDAPLPAFTISRFTRVNYGAMVATFTVSIAHVDISFALTMPEGKPAFASPAKIKCAYLKTYRAIAFVSDEFAASILSRALTRYDPADNEDDEE